LEGRRLLALLRRDDKSRLPQARQNCDHLQAFLFVIAVTGIVHVAALFELPRRNFPQAPQPFR
jgi:hypothetical protein